MTLSDTAARDDPVRAWLSLPRRIYVDTSTLQNLYDFGGEIFEGEPFEPVGRASRVQGLAAEIGALQMIFMMNKVVEEGTGKRAILDGVRAAGKTGTTNAYRDAWFMGYTGNYVCGIWFGNDNYDPTNRMTGGSLPAMTWHEIMAYAHQGIEVKNLPGLPPAKASPSAAGVAENKGAGSEQALRPTLLTKRGADILQGLEHRLENASRAMASSPGPGEQRGTKLEPPNTIAKAAEGSPVPRGN